VTTDPVAAEAIRSTIARYAHALDDGRTSDVVACFHLDGVVDLPGYGTYRGHAEIEAAFTKWKPVKPQRHLVTNTAIGPEVDGEIEVVSDLAFLLANDGRWSTVMVGRYHDVFRCVDGEWLLAHRATEFQEG